MRSTLKDRIGWLLVILGVACFVFVLRHGVFGDGRVRFDALWLLLENGELSHSAYSLVGPLFSIPLFYAGKLGRGPLWLCAWYNATLVAMGLGAFVWLLRKRTDHRTLQAFCLLILAASMFPAHVFDYFGEVFTAIGVLVGTAALAAGRPGLGWTALVLGVANTPATIVGLFLVSLRHVARSRKIRYFIPVLLAALIIMAEAWIRRGGPFVTGYEGNAGARTVLPYSALPGFSYPFFFGVLSILLSFGKGLLFFAPGLLLAGRRTAARKVPDPLRECLTDSLWFLAGLVVVYARWWSWYGGWFWGPRFFLVASIPASLALAMALRRSRELTAGMAAVVLGILSLSAWVGVNGQVFNQANMALCTQDHYALEFLCWYVPEFSALWRPFVVPVQGVTWRQELFAAYCAIAFVWLAAPVAGTLVRAARESTGAAVSQLRAWRF